jgi:hypothetical protein
MSRSDDSSWHTRTDRALAFVGMTGATGSAAAVPPLRGAVDVTAAMEVLQIGYLHAVVAAARCSLSSPNPDRGVDWVVTHEAPVGVADPEVDLKLQLKSTHTVPVPLSGDTFGFTLENAHLEKLATPNPTITRLLVVMLQPRHVDRWLMASHNLLAMRHCCYWVNLAGVAVSGSTRTTVRIAKSHVFDDLALCRIMQTIRDGQVPV